uniref:Uncharacterized protein n=1 Tax=Caenorhabditis japonica TaxID=281687 RepID=A0A8R1I7X2_CAEJA
MPMAAAKEDDIDERLNNCYKSLLDQKNHKLWQNIDAWIDKMQKEPTERRDREGLFEATRNSMICQIEFISLVLKHIGASRTGEMLTNSPHTEYIHFLHVANSTQFVKESEKLPQSNIFALLSELFSEIPEFSQEAGPLLDGLKQHLTLLLPSADMGWQKLTFNPRLFHKVYFSLCLVFNVTDNEDDSSSTSSDTSDGLQADPPSRGSAHHYRLVALL